MYAGQADWTTIREVKQAVSVPVIANGDVFAPTDAVRILQETGADGLMIGRGAMGNPWLFAKARQALRGEPVTEETLGERIDTAITHARWMVDFKGERLGIVEMRKHVGHYISGLRGASAIRREVNAMTTLKQLEALLLTLKAGEEKL